MDNINNRFHELRIACQKTQEEWGTILGITRSGVSEIEAGRRKVNDKHLIMLSNWKEKRVNIDWIRTGTGEMFIEISPYDIAYNRFGYIMENSSASKKAALSMLLELLYTVPDDTWNTIMHQFEEIKKEG